MFPADDYRKLRENAGLSVLDFARRHGFDPGEVERWESASIPGHAMNSYRYVSPSLVPPSVPDVCTDLVRARALANELPVRSGDLVRRRIADYVQDMPWLSLGGNFDSGKSSLVNLLLHGTAEVAARFAPTTSAATLFAHPDADPGGTGNAAHSRTALAVPLLSHCSLLDTPGDQHSEDDDARAINALSGTRHSITIFMSTYVTFLDEHEVRRLLDRLRVVHVPGTIHQLVVLASHAPDHCDQTTLDHYRARVSKSLTDLAPELADDVAIQLWPWNNPPADKPGRRRGQDFLDWLGTHLTTLSEARANTLWSGIGSDLSAESDQVERAIKLRKKELSKLPDTADVDLSALLEAGHVRSTRAAQRRLKRIWAKTLKEKIDTTVQEALRSDVVKYYFVVTLKAASDKQAFLDGPAMRDLYRWVADIAAEDLFGVIREHHAPERGRYAHDVCASIPDPSLRLFATKEISATCAKYGFTLTQDQLTMRLRDSCPEPVPPVGHVSRPSAFDRWFASETRTGRTFDAACGLFASRQLYEPLLLAAQDAFRAAYREWAAATRRGLLAASAIESAWRAKVEGERTSHRSAIASLERERAAVLGALSASAVVHSA